MSETVDEYCGSLREKANAAYYRAEEIAERAVRRRDNTKMPIIKSVLAGVAKFREWQLDGAIQEVQEVSDLYYRRDNS
ncbi:MAG TPA: hypothetical protein VFP35_03735 [Candidatus Saccharimonadales bacterium]|nr:hypothetical protein [Candidatus Saccharimonadales bacterium]